MSRYVAHANLESLEAARGSSGAVPSPVRGRHVALHGVEGFDAATGRAVLSQRLRFK